MRTSLANLEPILDSAEHVVPAPPPEIRVAANSSGMGRHALLMVSATVIVAVLNYALNIILGWALPVEQYGRIGVSQTLIFICLWLISAGLPWVVTRAIAQAQDASAGIQQREEAWRTYKTARLANIGLTLVVVGLLEIAFYTGWLPLESSYAPLILVVGITVAALGFGSVPNAGLQGFFRFGTISVIRVTEVLINLVVSVALVVAGFGATGALAGFAVAAVFSTGLAVWSVAHAPFSRVKGWGGLDALRSALPMTLAVFGGVLLTNIDLLSIKFLSSPANSDALSGAYQVAAVLARAPLFIGTALVSTFYPRIAQASGNLQSARELVRLVVMGLLPVNLILSLGAPAVVLFFFPERYASSGLLLAVLALGSACLVLASVLAAVLQARHQVKVPALVMTGAVLAQVVGLLLVVPAYGALAAAIVSAGASALAALLLAWYCKDLGLAPAKLPRYGLALAILAVPTLLLTWLLKDQGRVVVALWVTGSLALYGASIFALNLLDARAMAESASLPRSGPLGQVIRRVLAVGILLNNIGGRNPSRD